MQLSSLRYPKMGLILSSIIILLAVDSLARSHEVTIQDRLRSRIEVGGVPLKICIDDEPVYTAFVLPVF